MRILLVVNFPSNWPLKVRGVEIVPARQYLTDPEFNELRNVRVFNCCRSYAYQSLGYYVSLLAEARRHKPLPDIGTIQDMKSVALARVITDDIDDLVQTTLKTVHGDEFELSIYFGRTLAKRDQRLGTRLFNLFPIPMLRATFVRRQDWQLQSIRPIPGNEIPDSHRPSVVEAADAYFSRRDWVGETQEAPRYDLAVLADPSDRTPPSDEGAIRKLIRAAHRHDVGVEVINKDDFGRLAEFDALFIRATTAMNNFTWRFSRRAVAEGLAVIDDPVSIARCTNKVYQAERLAQHDVPTPPTVIVHRDNVDVPLQTLSLPIVLKQPDSSFSMGVVKVATEEEYRARVEALLEESDLVIAQSFMPTDFDWRVGVLDGEPLFACRYHMARHHWQIAKHSAKGKTRYGRVESLAVSAAPKRVVSTAVRAASLIGDGLYGVDLKQVNGRVYVIEVNDNPNLEAGEEDRVLKDGLYDRIIQSFIRRIERRREGAAGRA